MIIWGTRTMDGHKGEGNFNCPRCGPGKPFTHKSVNRWFTLYFIPIIPMGSVGEYIECRECAGTFDTQVLSHNPAAEDAELKASIRRIMALFLLESGRAHRDWIQRLVTLMYETLNETCAEHQVHEDIRMAQAAGANVASFAPIALKDLSSAGKVEVVKLAIRLCGGGHQVSYNDRAVIDRLGQAIGVPAPVVENLLQSVGG